ncbi:MAG TPA: esterase [Microscillaceae bacterium]|nr:esterase [Microscillaceae bacterium]
MNLKCFSPIAIGIVFFFGVACTNPKEELITKSESPSLDLSGAVWEVKRKIPPPDQASTVIQEFIIKKGQPNVETASKLSFPNEQAWMKYIVKAEKDGAKMARQLATKLNIKVKKRSIANVTVRYIIPDRVSPTHKNNIFIHLHGGAYVLNGGYAGITEALMIAQYVSIPVVSIDYRMPPKHPFPAAINDVLAVYKELLKEYPPKSIAIGGTSAGGGLVMASLHNFKAAKQKLLGAVFLGTPWADINKIGDSYFLNEGIDQLLVSYAGILKESANLYAGEHDKKDPLISPIYGDFTEYPPTYLVSGTRDLFLSNTIRTHRKLKSAGVIADLNVYEGISHGQYLLIYGSPENKQVFNELGVFLNNHLK